MPNASPGGLGVLTDTWRGPHPRITTTNPVWVDAEGDGLSLGD